MELNFTYCLYSIYLPHFIYLPFKTFNFGIIYSIHVYIYSILTHEQYYLMDLKLE